jgi:hypothetical protein
MVPVDLNHPQYEILILEFLGLKSPKSNVKGEIKYDTARLMSCTRVHINCTRVHISSTRVHIHVPLSSL